MQQKITKFQKTMKGLHDIYQLTITSSYYDSSPTCILNELGKHNFALKCCLYDTFLPIWSCTYVRQRWWDYRIASESVSKGNRTWEENSELGALNELKRKRGLFIKGWCWTAVLSLSPSLHLSIPPSLPPSLPPSA